MSEPHDSKHPINEDITFEGTDVSTKPVALSVAILAVFTVIFTAAGHLTYFGFAERERASSPEPSPLAEYAAKEPPLPRLQIHPKTDLDVLRAAEAKVLTTLGWVDKEKGIVRVPIERAMEMVAAQNLPARQGPVPWKMAPRGVAPSQPAEAAGAPDWQEGGYSAADGLAAHGHGQKAAHAPAAHGHGEKAAHAPAAHGEPEKAHGH